MRGMGNMQQMMKKMAKNVKRLTAILQPEEKRRS